MIIELGGERRAAWAMSAYLQACHPEGEERILALEVLWFCGPHGVAALARDLGNADLDVVDAALGGLTFVGPDAATAVPEITALFKSERVYLRYGAAVALGAVGAGSGKAIPDLVAGLHDDSHYVRTACADALGSIGPAAASAGPDLWQLLLDENVLVRRAAAEALKRIEHPEAPLRRA